MLRRPVRAGSWYPASAEACHRFIEAALHGFDPDDPSSCRGIGAVVPHAGWEYSGRLAVRTLATAGRLVHPRSILLLGAVHVAGVRRACLIPDGVFATPLGDLEIDEDLAKRLVVEASDLVEASVWPHVEEHSIEVVAPILAALFPAVKVVPVLVPARSDAVSFGIRCADISRSIEAEILAIASTDLTHYGGRRFGFAPRGEGEAALRWVLEENDRRVIDLALDLDAESIVPEARVHHNACGPGALAALLAYARRRGATRGVVVGHTSSVDVESLEGLGEPAGRQAFSDGFVSYAGIVLFAEEASTASGASDPPASV